MSSHPSYPRPSLPRANERYARYFALLDDQHRPLSGVDLPSSPLSAISCAGSWSGSSNTQEQSTPPTPDCCFPAVAVASIVTPGEAMVSSSPIPEETSPAETAHSKLPHRVNSPTNSAPVDAQHEINHHPIAITCNTRCLPHDVLASAPSLQKNNSAQLPPPAWRRKIQHVPQKHVSWLSATDSPSIPVGPNTRIPPAAPVEPLQSLPEDDVKNVQSFLKGLGELDSLENHPAQQEKSHAMHHDKTLPLSPKKRQDSTSDEFLWEARHRSFVDPDELVDSARCSLLIQEVSLMVGLTSDHDQPNLDRGTPSDSHPSSDALGYGTARDIPRGVRSPAPLSVTPPDTLAPRRRETASVSSSRWVDRQVCPSQTPVPLGDNLHTKNADAGVRDDYPFLKEASPLVGPRGSATPISRHKSADAIHPAAHSRRRHGQVFQFHRSTDSMPSVSHANIGGTQVPPYRPISKPLPSPPSRLSSLNRLECSLEKLKAHAPPNHHKSMSEGTSPSYLGRDERPTVLRKQQSNYEMSQRRAPRPAPGRHFSSPMPPISVAPPAHSDVVGLTRTTPSSEDEHLSTPGSFMDMDIPAPDKAPQGKRISFRYATNNQTMKNLVQSARKVGRKVLTWGKHLAGPPKPSTNAVKATPSSSPLRSSYI